jgi:hypothetical protein
MSPARQSGQAQSSNRAPQASRAYRFGREDVDKCSGSGPASTVLAWYGRRVQGTGSRPDLRFG